MSNEVLNRTLKQKKNWTLWITAFLLAGGIGRSLSYDFDKLALTFLILGICGICLLIFWHRSERTAPKNKEKQDEGLKKE
jgi:CHASE2 domain-containing sensor protein